MDSQVETLLQSFGVAPRDYARAVTEHEAAHIVRGLSDGFRLKKVVIQPTAVLTATGGNVSGGNCEWEIGTRPLGNIIKVPVAGAAWDGLNAPSCPCLKELNDAAESMDFSSFIALGKKVYADLDEQFFANHWLKVRTEVGDWFSTSERKQQVKKIATFLHEVLERGDREVPLAELRKEVQKIIGEDAASLVGVNA